MSDLRDLRARQQFLKEQISRNRADAKANGKNPRSVFFDPFFISRLVEQYESVYERKYALLKQRLRVS